MSSDPEPPLAEAPPAEDLSWSAWFVDELTGSYLNVFLLCAILYLVYKIFKSDTDTGPSAPPEPPMPDMKKQDMTLQQLKQYNGLGPDGRICVAVNGKIYDVTRGKRFYGPGGPYEAFAGHDASRGLATFNVAPSDDYDDLSDLQPSEMESVREWELQFSEKYVFVGKLIKPGEEPTSYSDDDDDDEDEKSAAAGPGDGGGGDASKKDD